MNEMQSHAVGARATNTRRTSRVAMRTEDVERGDDARERFEVIGLGLGASRRTRATNERTHARRGETDYF